MTAINLIFMTQEKPNELINKETERSESITPASYSLASDGSNPLPSAVTMWKRAWVIYRKRMKTFMGIAAVSAVVAIINFIITESRVWGWPYISLAFLWLAFIPVTFAYIYAIEGGESVGFGEAFRRALKKFPRALWLAIISFVIITGMSFYFLFPAIIFGSWFIFAKYVLALENQGGMNALFYSREYVRGRWWTVVGYFLFLMLVTLAVIIIPYVVFSVFKFSYLREAVNIVVGFFIGPVTAIYMYLVYVGFKATKGQISVKTNAGRKAKYIITALAGIIVLLIVTIGIVIIMAIVSNGRINEGVRNVQSTPKTDILLNK